ncbi:hypothetical protein CRC_00514 [Cylindrospermopsis raciborskii CS-505]|nr:hypothetical protein CRC_00514 [Cylindrospermopsis raciborskii CS-505]
MWVSISYGDKSKFEHDGTAAKFLVYAADGFNLLWSLPGDKVVKQLVS